MSESIVPEEQKEYNGITLEGWKLYLLIILVLFVLSTVSYNAMSARSEVQKVNTQLTLQKSYTGAKIDTLMRKREDNRKQWSEEQKKIDSSMIKQAKLNDNTENIEEELRKYNISVIN